MERQPAAESIVHDVARPFARTLTWALVAAPTAALAPGSVRNLGGR